MQYIDGFRNPAAAAALGQRIRRLGTQLAARGRRARIMEVCGTHTVAIARHGIRDLLPDGVEMISGPGCPVCVTDPGYVDAAIAIAGRGATVATFGDMTHVPGSSETLARCRSRGGHVEVCYSPESGLDLARGRPGREVVFLGIGFETTTAPIAAAAAQAAREGLANFSLLTAFKRVPPALVALMSDPQTAVDAFLCPAHVSAIIGAGAYEPVSRRFGIPCVIAGFEPLDILLGLAGILEQLLDGRAEVENQYSRVVKQEGNARALAAMEACLRPCDADWRGIGTIPDSGLALRPEFARHDAAAKFGIEVRRGSEHPGCRCGDVLKGKLPPAACALFGAACTPDRPVGPCMVSSEGTCAAYFKYSRLPPGGRATGGA